MRALVADHLAEFCEAHHLARAEYLVRLVAVDDKVIDLGRPCASDRGLRDLPVLAYTGRPTLHTLRTREAQPVVMMQSVTELRGSGYDAGTTGRPVLAIAHDNSGRCEAPSTKDERESRVCRSAFGIATRSGVSAP